MGWPLVIHLRDCARPQGPTELVFKTIAGTISVGSEAGNISNVTSHRSIFFFGTFVLERKCNQTSHFTVAGSLVNRGFDFYQQGGLAVANMQMLLGRDGDGRTALAAHPRG